MSSLSADLDEQISRKAKDSLKIVFRMSREGSLWMGGLEAYMDEPFIKNAFLQMGEDALNVKVMRNKYTGEPAGYCFVQFKDDQMALQIMHRLNGKIIPNSQPPIRFKLNHASMSGRPPLEREFSLWIGDLTPDVDDYALYQAFATRYQSIRTAKVIMDNSGFSRGYGFIHFANEEEHKDALVQMSGFRGLGGRPIKVSLAVQKGYKYAWGGNTDQYRTESERSSTSATAAVTTTMTTATTAAVTTTPVATQGDYSQYYEQYWQNYAAWQNYGNYYSGYAASMMMGPPMPGKMPEIEDEFQLIEHNVPLDVETMNRALIERSYEFWDALDNSRWLPPEPLEP